MQAEDFLFKHVDTVHNLGSVTEAMEEYANYKLNLQYQCAEVNNFASEMQNQLNNNAIHLEKTDWRQFKNLGDILWELEYHKAKLMLAMREANLTAIREYIADCGNILMFLGNAYNMYQKFEPSIFCTELKPELFDIKLNSHSTLTKFGNNEKH